MVGFQIFAVANPGDVVTHGMTQGKVQARIAVVGCGNVSEMHLAGYLKHPDRVMVAGGCDPDESRRQLVRDKYSVPETRGTLAELIQDLDFDTAVVCTPSHVRLDTVRILAEAGKHILVEKPMAETLSEARAIVETCAEAGVKLAVNQNFRSHYSFGLAREAIKSGEIGRVIGIEHRDLMFREVEGWRAAAERHVLSVMGIHWFDGFRYLLEEDADWLIARTHSSPALNTAGETDAYIQMHFGTATVNYTQSFSCRINSTETIVFGEKGSLLLGYETMKVVRADGSPSIIYNPHAGDGKRESAFLALASLLDAVENDGEPENSGADNLKTLALMAASYESASSGKPVTLTGGMI